MNDDEQLHLRIELASLRACSGRGGAGTRQEAGRA